MNPTGEGDDTETSPTAPAQPPAVEKRRSYLLFESILIVLSVLLGFALSAGAERRSETKTMDAALANFRLEIQSNLEEVERLQPTHSQFAERLGQAANGSPTKADETAFDAFVRLMREVGYEPPLLGEAAWETATTTGALRLIDYDIAAALSEAYLIQRSTVRTQQLLSERFSAAENFDPAARDIVVRAHQMMLVELAGQESYLIEVYHKALERLPLDSGR